MRNGKLLDEGPPSFLLNKYGCSTIESVFLLLSAKQESKLQEGVVDSNLNTTGYNDVVRNEVSARTRVSYMVVSEIYRRLLNYITGATNPVSGLTVLLVPERGTQIRSNEEEVG